jgi:hypothetical protein
VQKHIQDLGYTIDDLARLLNLLPDECSRLYAPDLRPGPRLISTKPIQKMA